MIDAPNMNNMSGLSGLEAKNRLIQYGENIVEEKRSHRFILFAKKFWSPVPWMLEVTILLQLVLKKYDEAIIVAALLLFNSLLSFFQEERANKVLALLRHHLARIFHEGYGESSNNPIRFICLTKNKDDFRHDTVYQGKIRISSLPRQDSRSSIC